MNIKIGKSNLTGKIKMISSKSNAHRLLIGAALADEPTHIQMEGWSADIEATKNCLEALGSEIEKKDGYITVKPIAKKGTEEAILDCGESGSTLRFLLPVAAALERHVIMEGQGRLPERPIGVLLEELKKHSCQVGGESLPLELSGGLRGGIYTLPGNISSQFITGLLFALPLLEEDSEIRLTTEMESKGYVEMTLETLGLFGIQIEERGNGYFVKGGQRYQSPKEAKAEGDWSGAAFWLTAGVMGGDVLCTGLRWDSCQGDKEIAALLTRFGGKITWEEDGIRGAAGKLRGISIDAAQIPDLVPILCTAAALAEGKTEIYNAGRLRIKESDRLKAMTDGLSKLGVLVEEKEDGIVILGRSIPAEGDIVLDGYGDHRIVMSLAVAASALGVEAVIEGAEAVMKSYPPFFAEFVKLGGIADVF